MYKPSYFQVKDFDQILAFIQAHPFATVIGHDGTYPVATQVPVQVKQQDSDLILVGHVMRKTDHCTAFEQNENVLVIFTGAHAYISASVYESTASASTWNYQTVQAKGMMKLLDREGTRDAIRNLTDSYENPAGSPAAFHQMDEGYIEKNLNAIRGFEIKVTELNAVFKLSQNHSENNQKAIISSLQQRNDSDSQEIARLMEGGITSAVN